MPILATVSIRYLNTVALLHTEGASGVKLGEAVFLNSRGGLNSVNLFANFASCGPAGLEFRSFPSPLSKPGQSQPNHLYDVQCSQRLYEHSCSFPHLVLHPNLQQARESNGSKAHDKRSTCNTDNMLSDSSGRANVASRTSTSDIEMDT